MHRKMKIDSVISQTMKLFVHFLFISSVVSTPQISCTFYDFASRFYICDLLIDNQNDFDNFSSIDGQHLPSKTDSDVTQVHLSGNSEIFPKIICESFENLKRIFASNFKVDKISPNSFESCSNLLQLDLQSSEISEISSNSFEKLSKLEILNLKSNQLSTLDDEIFQPLTSLLELNLDENPLKTFKAQIPPQLEKISLRNCSLEGSWKNSENFKYVDIGQNSLKEIEKNSFASSKIFAFLADENQIEVLDAMSFGGDLKILMMNGNKLKAIDFYFEEFENLEKFEVECEEEKFDGENWETLESCFGNFENRAIDFSLNSDTPLYFNTIRNSHKMFQFSIMAASDVSLTLTDSLLNASELVEIHFGADNNTKSILCINGKEYRSYSGSEGLLSETAFKSFIVHLNGIRIQVLFEGFPFLISDSSYRPEIRFYGFHSRTLADIRIGS